MQITRAQIRHAVHVCYLYQRPSYKFETVTFFFNPTDYIFTTTALYKYVAVALSFLYTKDPPTKNVNT